MAKLSRAELPAFAHTVAGLVRARAPEAEGRAFRVYLSGDLGSGKTTFMQAFARELGIAESVKSSTFVLMKNYPLQFGNFLYLAHIDAYRLQSAEEFESLQPKTFLNDPHALVCIEWPEQVGGALPKPDIYLKFTAGEERDVRDIEIF